MILIFPPSVKEDPEIREKKSVARKARIAAKNALKAILSDGVAGGVCKRNFLFIFLIWDIFGYYSFFFKFVHSTRKIA